MNLPPFVRDLGERAGKSYLGGIASYLFESVIGDDFRALPWWHANEFGIGTALASVLFSLISRRRKSDSGEKTPSLLREVGYVQAPPSATT